MVSWRMIELDNVDDLWYGLVAAMIIVDTWEMYLCTRNIRSASNMTEIPREMTGLMSAQDFKRLRGLTIKYSLVYMINNLFNLSMTLAKLVFPYYPYVWAMTADYGKSLRARTMWFYCLDILIKRSAVIPFAVLIMLLSNKPQESRSRGFVNIAMQTVLHSLSEAAGSLGLIYLTDKFGTRGFILLILPTIIIGLVTEPLKIRRKRNSRKPLGNDDLGEKLKSLSNSVNYPVNNIKINPNSTTTPEVTFEISFASHIISINQPLLSLLTPEQITGLVAHEMGHWRYHHTTFQNAFRLIQTACSYFVCIMSLDNEWITKQFGFSEELHPFVPFYLCVKHFWPIAEKLFNGFRSLMKRRSEFSADRFAVAEGHASHLRSSLLTLGGRSKCYPIFDPWYSGWFNGYPTVFERITHLENQ